MNFLPSSLSPKQVQWIIFSVVWGAVVAVICSICWIILSPNTTPQKKNANTQAVVTASKNIDPREVWVDRMESDAKDTTKRLAELEKAYSDLAKTKFDEADSETKRVIDELQGQINELQIQLDNKISSPQENADISAEPAASHQDLSFSNTRTPRVIKLNLTSSKGARGQPLKTVDSTIPAGAFATAIILSGVDGSTALQASSDPRPVLLRLASMGTLPRKFKSDLEGCHVLAAAHGDISSERVLMRLEKLTCVERSTGEISETQVSGYIAGEDGKAGVRGGKVDKTGPLLREAFLGGFASGVSKFFAASNQANVYPVTPFGQTNALTNPELLRSGSANGIGSALDAWTNYKIKKVEQLHEILQVQAGREVTVVFTESTPFGKTTVKEAISQAREGALRDSRQKIQEEAIRTETLKADEVGSLNMESLSRWLPNKGEN